MKRSRDLAGLATLAGAAAIALGLSACSTQSPSVITTPYPASDGVSASIGDSNVDLRNFMAVGAAQGAPAEVLGVIVNDSASPVTVALAISAGASTQATPTQVQVPAHGTTELGPEAAVQMLIPQLPAAPGADTGLTAQTQAGGTIDLSIPILLPQGAYASLTPGATPSGTAKPTGTATPLTSGTATPTPTGTATTKAKKKKKSTSATSTATATPTS